jgi:ABC-type bacteriocin/lantibiotic exporter with double-glycine peptidase domain
MANFRIIRLLIFIILFILAGCCKPGEPELYPVILQSLASGEGKLLPVENTKQYWRTCGPAALATSLKYLGIQITQESIAEEMNGYDGVTDEEMIATAKRHGVEANVIPFSDNSEKNWGKLKALIDERNPVIVGIKHSTCMYSRYHYMTVVGYTISPRIVIVHNGTDPYMPLSWETFYPMWDADRFTMILHLRHISPESPLKEQ